MTALLAHYHRLCKRILTREQQWHFRQGVSPHHPYMRGLTYCIATHDRALVRLHFNL